MSLKKVLGVIEKNRTFLVSSHVNLEGDAIGSALAIAHLLKLKGKDVVVVNEDAVPLEYSFMPAQEYIRPLKGMIRSKRKFDVAILSDCADLSRAGSVCELIKDHPLVVNIDHHVSNNNFGDVNWVEPTASSACEMVFKLYKRSSVPFDKVSSFLLYVGLFTDTGLFRYSNTNPFSHQMAAELLTCGINPKEAYSLIYEANNFEDMMILAGLLSKIKRDPSGRIVWIKLSKDIWGGRKWQIDLSDHILSFALSIKGVEVVMVIKENLGGRDEVRVNFRSKRDFDVSRIAMLFGGGGHKAASGCTVKGNINAVEKKIISAVKKEMRLFNA